MPKYRFQQIIRVLMVVRVDAEDKEDAFEKGDGLTPETVPKDTDCLWAMGIEDGSTKVELDDGTDIVELGYSILESEEME
jgi:hypothetical protein